MSQQKTVTELVTQFPDNKSIIGWGSARLTPSLFRDMITYASRHSESTRFAYAVDINVANWINQDPDCPIVLSGDYKPARQNGTRIGAYAGCDMHVYEVPDLEENWITLFVLNDDGTVEYACTSRLEPVEKQRNIIPSSTHPDVVRILGGAYGGNFPIDPNYSDV